MSVGLSREELDIKFNEHLDIGCGQLRASQTGENPTIARKISELNLSEESKYLSVLIGVAASAILDTIADNNSALN